MFLQNKKLKKTKNKERKKKAKNSKFRKKIERKRNSEDEEFVILLIYQNYLSNWKKNIYINNIVLKHPIIMLNPLIKTE